MCERTNDQTFAGVIFETFLSVQPCASVFDCVRACPTMCDRVRACSTVCERVRPRATVCGQSQLPEWPTVRNIVAFVTSYQTPFRSVFGVVWETKAGEIRER